jgi:hypothetical protein
MSYEVEGIFVSLAGVNSVKESLINGEILQTTPTTRTSVAHTIFNDRGRYVEEIIRA